MDQNLFTTEAKEWFTIRPTHIIYKGSFETTEPRIIIGKKKNLNKIKQGW
jgi:hypothetical protein